MDAFICTTCGTQHAPSREPPSACAICTDERQYVPPSGQAWTTLEQLRSSHASSLRQEGELMGIGIAPAFAINQRALLVRTPHGNILWDCVSLVNEPMVTLLEGIGGLAAIAISHPHYYTTMVEWSHAFGRVPVHLHEADREWVMRSDPCLAFWRGDRHEIAPGLTLVRLGGHFEGGTVLHWAAGAGGRGAVLGGDILQVVADRRHVAFMRSYPNYVPLGARAVRTIAARMEPWSFEAIYGAFWGRTIPTGGKGALAASAERHVAWIERALA